MQVVCLRTNKTYVWLSKHSSQGLVTWVARWLWKFSGFFTWLSSQPCLDPCSTLKPQTPPHSQRDTLKYIGMCMSSVVCFVNI